MKLKLWRAVLVIVLIAAVTAPARAESLQTAEDQVLAGIVIVSVAIGVLVTILVLHYKHKKTILTGCVTSAANGLLLTDEKDKRTYTLSGDLASVKLGDRMTLEGKRKQSGQTLVFDTQRARQDYGACQP